MDAAERVARAADRPQSVMGRALNLIGAGLVAYTLAVEFVPVLAPVLSGVLALAVLSWVLRVLIPLGWTILALIAELVMLAGGALTAVPTGGLGIAPAFAGIVMLLSRVRRPLPLGLAAGVCAVALIAVGSLLVPGPLFLLLSMEGTLLLAGALGFSRRQARLSEAKTQLLLEERVAVAQERALSATLAERSRIARDMHDVLAHSLGGLVIQLDAVDALLESGDIDAARSRIIAARGLAADGLGDARRAVAALRAPDADEQFGATITDLIAAHRELGGHIDFVESGTPQQLDAAQSEALARTLQESLSNARKHAPGQPVGVALDWADAGVRLAIENPIATPTAHPVDLANSGGGVGLTGMRDRFAALRGGGAVLAGRHGDSFVVTAEVVLA